MLVAEQEMSAEVLDALDSGLAVLNRDRAVIGWNAWLASASDVAAADA